MSWIKQYGVFVDVDMGEKGKVDGMIHKSELSWGAVINCESVVTMGAPGPHTAPRCRCGAPCASACDANGAESCVALSPGGDGASPCKRKCEISRAAVQARRWRLR